jgi:hypothetical protein
MTQSPTPPAWFDDPLEIDRYLDGELDPATQAARDADVAAGRAPASILERRREFAALAAAGARWRAELPAAVPAGLESRVRFALQRDRRTAPRRWFVAAAAVLLVALGIGLFSSHGERAEAMPPEVIKAVDAARTSPSGPRDCDADGEAGPNLFPPVQDGSLSVWRCREDGRGTVAKLYRPEELPSLGYAAVAAEGVDRGPDLGRTDIGDMVVYDLVYGRRAHYLAVSKAWLQQVEARHPGRASCRACHNRSREGQKNPHNIVERSWRLGG